MAQRRAIVIGAGMGGLAAAAALHHCGWAVELHERAPSIEPVGAGLAMAPNALRALDTFGAGDPVRALAAIHGDGGLRRPDGGWLARTTAEAVRERFGDPLVVLERRNLVDLLRAAAADVPLNVDSPAAVLDPGDDAPSPAIVDTPAGERTAELVVAADGIGSAARAALFPEHPGLAPTGWTAWRFVIDSAARPPAGETWGPSGLVGLVPLAGNRLYVYAAARARQGERATDDEQAELLRRFGGWHAPIRELVEQVRPEDVLRNDIAELAAPLPAMHRGRVALLGDAAHPMAPFLGQGACQAIEDAVVLAYAVDEPGGLADYTAARQPRTTAVVRRSHRMGVLSLLRSPVTRAARDAAIRLAGRLSAGTAVRQMAPVADWRPPVDAPAAAARTD